MYQSRWYKWIALILFLLLLLCFFLKCCTNSSHSTYARNPLPSRPNEVRPIDPEKVEIVEDVPFDREAVNDLINVYLKENVDIESFSADFQSNHEDTKVVPTYYAEEYKRIQFQVEKREMNALMNELKSDTSAVKFVTREWVFRRSVIKSYNDPGYSDQSKFWFYESIGLDKAWNYTKGNDSILIAIIDDGFDIDHKELVGQSVLGWNVFNYSDELYGNSSNLFHGTHVAGTAVGNLDNNFGISGVAPHCKFIPVQISDESGMISITSILDGIFYSLKNEADVINLSLGFSIGEAAKNISVHEQTEIIKKHFKEEEALWDEVFSIAEESNVVIVQAAGNDNLLSAVDPMKRSKHCINVGALNSVQKRAEFSNYGDAVTIYAPGKQIYSAIPNGKMGFLDGTSMASPIVAGAVALIKSYRPEKKAEEIIQLIIDSADMAENKMIRIDKIFDML